MKKFVAGLTLFVALALGALTSIALHSALLGALVTCAVAATSATAARGFAFGVDPTGTTTDGTGGVQFGAQILTIATVAFCADDISVEYSTKSIVRNNQYGVPQAQVLIKEITKGSATLQLPTSSTAAPTVGGTFSLTDVGGGTINCILTKVGRAWKSDDLVKLNIEFNERFS